MDINLIVAAIFGIIIGVLVGAFVGLIYPKVKQHFAIKQSVKKIETQEYNKFILDGKRFNLKEAIKNNTPFKEEEKKIIQKEHPKEKPDKPQPSGSLHKKEHKKINHHFKI